VILFILLTGNFLKAAMIEKNNPISNHTVSSLSEISCDKESIDFPIFGKKSDKLQKIIHFIKQNKFVEKKFPQNGTFKLGAFLIGFLLGLIGVLIVFLVKYKAPDRKDYVNSAFQGWLAFMCIYLVLVLFLLS